ncbi:MAG: hypothetical protein KA298_06530, partial [Paludibacteraceae bacterium]|nr:hypothetical protein [Paludibacteraceae bacterium]
MQNRGLIKFFAIIFALVCIYQLSFTFVANGIAEDAKAFAKGDPKKELRYLDSLKKETVFLGKTYKQVTDNQINKGLDLEGGLNVILQISVKDILKGLANETKNTAFNKALADAKTNQQGNQDYIDAFFEEADRANLKLADVDIFRNKNLDGIIEIGMTNKQVQPIIKQKVNESVESAFKVLRERIDQFGVTQPNIQLLGNSGRILVELPGAKDVDKIKRILQTSAQLEFWVAHSDADAFGYLIQVNEALKKTEVAKKDATVKTSGIDSLLTDKADSTTAVNPLFDKLQLLGQQPMGQPVLGIAKVKDTAVINSYFKRADIKALLPTNLAYARMAWEKSDPKNPEFTQLYFLKGDASGKPALAGDMITTTRAEADELGKQGVTMNMNSYGTREWEKLTSRVAKEQGFIAIVMDNTVYSAPQVNEAIAGGSSRIS